ncbi:hypothetical protein [Rhizobium sp. L1K21]|uniref:hypothetical protein n=1 Tax=Rhizobium sp. L1K21 TaxID=2954933 RepID=UPI00209340BB|nr:hypothetical protein [Rhizobium sp. L1K21]MCO6188199.1 hypothetical protein [Rhizobium sp. L1K21]
MSEQNVWKSFREEAKVQPNRARGGALNAALLFGLAVLAFTMIVTPMLVERTEGLQFANSDMPAFDNITTGSIKKRDGVREYVVRRSVLQEMPGSVCIIESVGPQNDCK